MSNTNIPQHFYIAGLTNGLINVVHGRNGLQWKAVTADRNIASQLRQDILEGKFNPKHVVIKKPDRTLPGGRVKKWLALYYKGKNALWLNGSNGRFDASFTSRLIKILTQRIINCKTIDELTILWRRMTEVYGNPDKEGYMPAFSAELNKVILGMFRARKESLLKSKQQNTGGTAHE